MIDMYPKALFSEQKIRRVSVKKQQIQKNKYKCELKEMNIQNTKLECVAV